MNDSVLYPVQILREHLTGLEAAITVCFADPDYKPVHKLRTETRRVEALLVLAGLVPELPEHRKEAAALQRALTKLRRAAGVVRDLDVHRKILEGFATSEDARPDQQPAASADHSPVVGQKAKAKKKPSEELSTGADASRSTAALLSEAAQELRKTFGHERDRAAAKLQDVLQDHQVKVVKTAEVLLDVLQPANDLALPAADLLRDAEAVLARDGLLASKDLETLSEDELHTVRKAAKRARYLAESLPEDVPLVAAAQRFELLQDTGGQWHDALELARAARDHFGKAHELTATYRKERDERLKAYLAVLAAHTGEPAPAPKPPTSKPATPGKRPSRKRTAAKAA